MPNSVLKTSPTNAVFRLHFTSPVVFPRSHDSVSSPSPTMLSLSEPQQRTVFLNLPPPLEASYTSHQIDQTSNRQNQCFFRLLYPPCRFHSEWRPSFLRQAESTWPQLHEPTQLATECFGINGRPPMHRSTFLKNQLPNFFVPHFPRNPKSDSTLAFLVAPIQKTADLSRLPSLQLLSVSHWMVSLLPPTCLSSQSAP